MTETKYDVFISYTSADKEWVRNTFVPALEDTGLVCCDYYRDFDVGAPIVKEMERAILESRKTVLVLSPAYLASKWTEFENLMLQTLDAANQDRRLLPVIYKKCELPLRFRYMNCVNFDNPDDIKIEWQRLFKAIGKPISEQKATQLTASRADWCFKYPYAALPNFTGREAERQMLTEWLKDEKHPILVVRALGGFGKSALTWHWLNNDLDPAEWPKVVWWSFYDDREFGSFVRETLEYLTGHPANPNPIRQDVENLLNELERPGTLLVLDGFERALRAYSSMNAAYQEDRGDLPEHAYDRDCVSPLAEYFLMGISTQPEIKSKALMTTRLCPKILAGHGDTLLTGCTEKELTELDKDEALLFFQNLGIQGTRAEIEAACNRYGNHPLSLRLLGGLILKDFEQPKDIAVAKRKLNIVGNLKQRQHHVLAQAYDALSPERQRLFSRIACFRGAIDFKALQAITENPGTFQDDLRDFIERGLIHHAEETNQFDLHPIVRRYAYERLTAPDRTAAHTCLRDYFEAVPEPENIETLDDLVPVIELYHHMVSAGQFEKALNLFINRFGREVHYQFGNYRLEIELLSVLFDENEAAKSKLDDDGYIAFSLNQLANAYSLNGEPRRAVPLFEMTNDIYENKMPNKGYLAIGLGNVAQFQVIGTLMQAEANLHRSIGLCREIEDEFSEAIGHQELGRTLSYRGEWTEAKQELTSGLELFEKQNVVQSEGVVWAYRALRSLLLARDEPALAMDHCQRATEYAARALELAAQWHRPNARDFIRGYWLLGAAYRAKAVVSIRSEKSAQTNSTGDLEQAEKHLGEALRRCRAINLVESEADILLEVAKLRHTQGESAEAVRLTQEALTITERSGYVLQGADVHLFLAELALEGHRLQVASDKSNQEAAKLHAEAALKLAYCDGPPYHYKVAYEEAQRLLEKL